MPSGGGYYDPVGSGGGGGSGGEEKCPRILKGINLVSPNPRVLSELKIGSQLDLDVKEVNGNSSLRVLFNNEEAGAIVSPHTSQLIDCIQKEYRYIAIVTSLDGGSCVLEIRISE